MIHFIFIKKINLVAWALLLILAPITAWGQGFEFDEGKNPETEMKAIERRWAGKTLQVENTNPNARVRDLAKAFCSQYQNYPPNAGMTDYLKKNDNYSWEEKHYYIEDASRNGYIKCDMSGQFDFLTEICYWRRPNGRPLVGVLMQVGHEGEGTQNICSLLFYEFNPNTFTMTPDLETYQAVKDMVSKHHGTPSFRLPKEGKDISVMFSEWSEIEDFMYTGFLLKWTGSSFEEEEVK